MRAGILFGVALVLLGTATSAAAKSTVLEPTSAWTVDYGDEKCSLLRDFGPLDEGLGLRIDSYGSHTDFQVSVIGDRVPRPELQIPVRPINIALSPDPELRRDVRALTGTIGDYRYVQFGLSFLPAGVGSDDSTPIRELDDETMARRAAPEAPDLPFEATVDSLLVEVRRGDQVKLNTGPMAPALKALRACIDDLRASWGLDPAEQLAITRHAYPDPEAVEDVMENFPRDLGFRGINGFVPLRVMVDPNGVATECVVQLPEAPEQFREAACSNLGTKFEPALAANGQPVRSFYQTSVIYLVRRF